MQRLKILYLVPVVLVAVLALSLLSSRGEESHTPEQTINGETASNNQSSDNQADSQGPSNQAATTDSSTNQSSTPESNENAATSSSNDDDPYGIKGAANSVLEGVQAVKPGSNDSANQGESYLSKVEQATGVTNLQCPAGSSRQLPLDAKFTRFNIIATSKWNELYHIDSSDTSAKENFWYYATFDRGNGTETGWLHTGAGGDFVELIVADGTRIGK